MKKTILLALLLTLCSCASKLSKKESSRTETVDKTDFQTIDRVLSKLATSENEKRLYKNKASGEVGFQLIKSCRPEALGKLELVFQVDAKILKNSAELRFEGIKTRAFFNGQYDYMEAVYCDKEEVQAVYDSLISSIKESSH